jgi:hypothetical protein
VKLDPEKNYDCGCARWEDSPRCPDCYPAPPMPSSAHLAGVTEEEWAERRDPNADLIGFTFSYDDDSVWRCTGSVPWSDQYVTGTLLLVGGKTMENVVKPVAVVRRRKELDDA